LLGRYVRREFEPESFQQAQQLFSACIWYTVAGLCNHWQCVVDQVVVPAKKEAHTLHGAESVHKQRTGFKSMLKLVGMAEPSNARQKQESSQGRSI